MGHKYDLVYYFGHCYCSYLLNALDCNLVSSFIIVKDLGYCRHSAPFYSKIIKIFKMIVNT